MSVPGWVATQDKAFVRWANDNLAKRGIEPIRDLGRDLSDGVRLIQLVEIVSGESLGKHNGKPKFRVHKAENVNLALEFMSHRGGVQLHNIGAEDVVDGNRKLILGLLWILILTFTIQDISSEGVSAREGLLLWCQRRTAGYPGVRVVDFSASWQDGLAFCALLSRHRPDLMDFSQLDTRQSRDNLQRAFQLAETHVDIPQLLDVEDLVDQPRPDERSVMAYVAYWFHAFSALDRREAAGRRVQHFVAEARAAWQLATDYETRVRDLLRHVAARANKFESLAVDPLPGQLDSTRQLLAVHAGLDEYRRPDKWGWAREHAALVSLHSSIATKLATYSLAPYTAPAGLAPPDMARAMARLDHTEQTFVLRVQDHLDKLTRARDQHYVAQARALYQDLHQVAVDVCSVHGELEAQLEAITANSEKLKQFEDPLRTLRTLWGSVSAELHRTTWVSYDEVQHAMDLARDAVVDKLAFVENQMVARRTRNSLTSAQIDEFENVFTHFAKHKHNTLQEAEFCAALASLGVTYSPPEMADMFALASANSTHVTFDQFLTFMIDLTQDTHTSAQVFESFEDMADGKPYITQTDLHMSLLPSDVVNSLEAVLPKSNSGQGYDYQRFMVDIVGGKVRFPS